MPSCSFLVPSQEGSPEQQDSHIEVLPKGTEAHQVLGNGPCYSKAVGDGVHLYWQQSQLYSHHNPIASALTGSTICGDAVAVATTRTSEENLEKTMILKFKCGHGESGKRAAPPLPPVQQHTEAVEPQWAQLPGELLAQIIKCSGNSAAVARTLSQVCLPWRTAISSDKTILKALKFEKLVLREMPKRRQFAAALPWCVELASAAGNVSAALLAARYCQAQGCEIEARKHWTRAARAGHCEAMWRIGVSYYHGRTALQQDSEEALLWLTRVVRALLPSPLAETEQLSSSLVLPPKDPSPSPSSACLLMSPALIAETLRESAHILGVIYLDGDATKQDTAAALKWLEMSRQHGCVEAAKLLHSLFRSGQY